MYVEARSFRVPRWDGVHRSTLRAAGPPGVLDVADCEDGYQDQGERRGHSRHSQRQRGRRRRAGQQKEKGKGKINGGAAKSPKGLRSKKRKGFAIRAATQTGNRPGCSLKTEYCGRFFVLACISRFFRVDFPKFQPPFGGYFQGSIRISIIR